MPDVVEIVDPVTAGAFPTPTIAEAPPAVVVAAPAPPAVAVAAPAAPARPDFVPVTAGGTVSVTSLDDTSVTVNDFALYKGRKGVADRIFILNARGLPSARAHYQEGKGYFLCHSQFEIIGGQETCVKPALCCQKLDESTKRFAALILHYAVNAVDGKLLQPFQYSLKLWRISDNRFVELRDIHSEFPLDKHDLTIRCTEENFQKLTIQASATSVYLQLPPSIKSQIDAWVAAMGPKAVKSLGRKLTDQELRERLGVAVAAAAIVNETPIIDASALFAE